MLRVDSRNMHLFGSAGFKLFVIIVLDLKFSEVVLILIFESVNWIFFYCLVILFRLDGNDIVLFLLLFINVSLIQQTGKLPKRVTAIVRH